MLSRLGRWPGWLRIVLVALALWLGIIGWVLVKPRYNYQPTGDKLFDRLAVQMLDAYYETKPRTDPISNLLRRLGWYNPPDLDWTEISTKKVARKMRLDYSDPRQLELAIASGLAMEVNVPQYDPPGTDYYNSYEQRREREYNSQRVRYFESGQVPMSTMAFDSVRYYYFEDEDRAVKLVQRGIDQDPGNSYFYYEMAWLKQGLGEMDVANDYVVKGNEAKQNYLPLNFPLDELYKCWDGFTTRDSRTAWSLIFYYFGCHSAGHPVYLKTGYKELEAAVNLGYPIEKEDAYVIEAKRRAEMRPAMPLQQYNAAVLAWIPIQACDDRIDLTKPEALERQVLLQDLGRITHIQDPHDILKNMPPAVDLLYRCETGGLYDSDIQQPDILLRMFDAAAGDLSQLDRNQRVFDILDPPPFAVWAQGGTLGLDTSGVRIAPKGKDGLEEPKGEGD